MFRLGLPVHQVQQPRWTATACASVHCSGTCTAHSCSLHAYTGCEPTRCGPRTHACGNSTPTQELELPISATVCQAACQRRKAAPAVLPAVPGAAGDAVTVTAGGCDVANLFIQPTSVDAVAVS